MSKIWGCWILALAHLKFKVQVLLSILFSIINASEELLLLWSAAQQPRQATDSIYNRVSRLGFERGESNQKQGGKYMDNRLYVVLVQNGRGSLKN